MRPSALKTLTWATVAAAVASALWLALVEAELGSTWRLTFAPSTSVNGLPVPGALAAGARARPQHVGQQQRATHQVFHRF